MAAGFVNQSKRVAFNAAYAIRLTPWERAGRAGAARLGSLLDTVETELGRPGRALDVGCGTGAHSLQLAKRGWSVVGADIADLAIRQARTKARTTGSRASFVTADATGLNSGLVGDGFDLVLDVGCFHGLAPAERAAVATAVTQLCHPHAHLLMLAVHSGRLRRPLLRGAGLSDIQRAYHRWQLVSTTSAPEFAVPQMLQRAEPTWYHLLRQEG